MTLNESVCKMATPTPAGAARVTFGRASEQAFKDKEATEPKTVAAPPAAAIVTDAAPCTIGTATDAAAVVPTAAMVTTPT